MDGITIPDVYSRYSETVLGVPPEKNGDYAWLLDVLKSLKSNGKAAIILPHGVLANLFYGTGIPDCILVLEKEDTAERTGIFMRRQQRLCKGRQQEWPAGTGYS